MTSALSEFDVKRPTILAVAVALACDVSTGLDNGYRASNSVSGSRFDTPIRDLPFAIKSFIEDQKPKNIFDLTNISRVEVVTLVNAMLGRAWRLGGWRMSLARISKNIIHQSHRSSQSTPSRPREFLLTFTTYF